MVATPSNPATVGDYDYYGCMTEGTNSRALQGYTTAYDSMTLESCSQDCAGFEYCKYTTAPEILLSSNANILESWN